MKIIEVVNIHKEGGKFFKSLFIIAGLLFLSTFVLTLLFLVVVNLLAIEIESTDIEIQSIRLSGISIGLLLGIYVGMCVQKGGGLRNKW